MRRRWFLLWMGLFANWLILFELTFGAMRFGVDWRIGVVLGVAELSLVMAIRRSIVRTVPKDSSQTSQEIFERIDEDSEISSFGIAATATAYCVVILAGGFFDYVSAHEREPFGAFLFLPIYLFSLLYSLYGSLSIGWHLRNLARVNDYFRISE